MSAAAPPVSRLDLSAVAAHRPGRPRGDDDLNPGLGPTGPLRAAAVLVPIVDRPEGATILLTRRTAHLAAHAGQISFPGGSLDVTDPDLLTAALRETEEEIGLPRSRVEIVGQLDTYVTRTGFEVTPFVGRLPPPVELRPDPYEVAEVFELPLALILAEGQPERHSRMFGGRERFFHAFPYGEYLVWGATAGMLKNLRDILLAGRA